jgi:KaiC/GvpD/RAD55 family RecA-like ATPase
LSRYSWPSAIESCDIAGLMQLNQDGANIVYCAGLVASKSGGAKRADGNNLSALVAIVVDIDDPEAAQRVDAALDAGHWLGSLRPTFVVETSPGRYQVGYALAEPADWTDADVRGQWTRAAAKLRDLWGADPCTTDPAHYWRVPGFINHPTAKKRAQGREPVVSTLRLWAPDQRYHLASDFDHLPEPQTPTYAPSAPSDDDVPPPDWTASTRALWERVGPSERQRLLEDGDDRSRSVAWAVRRLSELGGDPADIFRVLLEHRDGPARRFWEQAYGDDDRAQSLLWRDVQSIAAKFRGKRAAGDAWSEHLIANSGDGGADGSAHAGDRTDGTDKPESGVHMVEDRRGDDGKDGHFSVTPLPIVWMSDIEPVLDVQDFVEGALVDGAMSCLYGNSGTGKSFIALDLAARVAAGVNWHGREVEQGPVMYIACEGGVLMRNRLVALNNQLTAMLADLGREASIPFAFVRASLNLRDSSEDVERVINASKQVMLKAGRPPRLIVVDTLARTFGAGEESSPVDMGQYVQSIDHMREASGAHAMIVHHTGKDEARGARGHSSLRAALDTEMEVSRAGANVCKLRVAKQRDLADGDEFRFQLKDVCLGTDRRRRDVTTKLVLPLTSSAKASAPKLGASARKALSVLQGLVEHGDGEVSPKAWKEACGREKLSKGSPEAQRKAFQRARQELEQHGLIAIEGDRVSINEGGTETDMSGTRPNLSATHSGDGDWDGQGQPPIGLSCLSHVPQGGEGEEPFEFSELDLSDVGFDEAA